MIVTGASRGIGRAIAIQLAAQKYSVAIHYRSHEQQAKETLKEIHASGGTGYLLRFDIADRQQTRESLEEDMANRGPYWGVVLNAGIAADAPLPSIADEDWDRVIATNLTGFFNVLKPLVMPMIRHRCGGRIVTLSSVSGLTGNRGQTNYAASKGGIIAATKSLARELAKRQITVNSVAPGLIETDMTQDLPIDEIAKSIPLRRLGKPEEVAGLVGFLFTEAAAYITGQVISVNGGLF